MAKRLAAFRRSDIRAQSIVLCVCLAAIALIDLSTPGALDRAGQAKGADFIGFYVLGSVARDRTVENLYDPDTERLAQDRLIPEAVETHYLPVYGPQVYLFFAPFARWPYLRALAIWSVISALTYALCCGVVWHACPNLRDAGWTVAIVAAANPAFFNLLLHGQSSAMALAFLTAMYVALRNGNSFLAGASLGMLAYKPQLGLVAAAVFVFAREWRVVAGAVATVAAQMTIAWMYFGTSTMVEYWHAMARIGQINPLLAIKPHQMHSLFAFWKLLLPWQPLAAAVYAVGALALAAIAIFVWRSDAPLPLRYSMLLLVTALVSPHLYVYDLVILVPAFLLTTDWTLAHPRRRFARPIQRLLYAAYALPLFGGLTQFTRIQLSVLAMAGLSVLVARSAWPSADEPAGEALRV